MVEQRIRVLTPERLIADMQDTDTDIGETLDTVITSTGYVKPGTGIPISDLEASAKILLTYPQAAFVAADIGMAMCIGDPVNYTGSLALTAGYMYLSMVRAASAATINNLAVNVSSGPSGSTVAYMGLYDLGASPLGATATLVAQTADIHAGLATSTKSFPTTSPYTLIPGHYYYIGLFCDAATSVYCTSSTTGPQNIRVVAGGVTTTGNGTGARGMRSNVTVSALPSTFATSAYTQTAIFWFGAF